jgi:hypothetical protein
MTNAVLAALHGEGTARAGSVKAAGSPHLEGAA